MSPTKRSYTIAFKLEVIKYAEDTSNHRASSYFKIDRRHVQEWQKQKKDFEAIRNNKELNISQVRTLEGRRCKVTYPILEKKLLEFIKKKREEKGVVTTSMIIKKAKELA
ncbi:16495_t:CDS:2 [Gigaspora rosea]|nr:16495_t:CDS:2 [Gigaspora rosea]